ncbi:hypothetical protein [Burkholderia territorii]|uniref:hypothetical protein n=1 Tax=Burkholderia territorii TaxID=1503055 RepID=UPI000A40D00C|nr:hypothetical protein [Burkholderia territorii]
MAGLTAGYPVSRGRHGNSATRRASFCNAVLIPPPAARRTNVKSGQPASRDAIDAPDARPGIVKSRDVSSIPAGVHDVNPP